MSKLRRNENGNHRNARSSQKSVCAFATFAAEAIQIRPQIHPKFHQYGPRADSLENRGNKSVFAESLGLPRSQNENSTARTRRHLLYHSPDAAIALIRTPLRSICWHGRVRVGNGVRSTPALWDALTGATHERARAFVGRIKQSR